MPPETWIRHIAASSAAPVFATALFEHAVTTWDFSSRREINSFHTILDFGGYRLALVDGDELFVVAGAYRRGGVCAYHPASGETVWQRRDVRPVQHLTASGQDGLIAVGLEGRPLHILHSRTGETVRTFRGASVCSFGPVRDEVVLTGRRGQSGLYSLASGKRLCTYALGQGSLSVAQTASAVLLTDFGADQDDWPTEVTRPLIPGGLLCYARDGEFMWHAEAPLGSHFLKVAWSEHLRLWLGIQWAYSKGGPWVLKAFCEDGSLAHETQTGPIWEADFLLDSRYLITSDGQVLALPSLELVWQFRPRD